MAAGRLLLSIVLVRLAGALSNLTTTTVTKTTTGCTLETPTWIYPILYSPCDFCNPCLITDVHQPITSAAVTGGTTTKFIAPYWDWNFHRTKTVTVIVDTLPCPSPQIQTWFAGQPTFSACTVSTSNGIRHHYQYENIIVYVVEGSNYVFNYPITVTVTSTVTSVFTNTIQTESPASQTPNDNPAYGYTPGASQQEGQYPSAGQSLRPAAGGQTTMTDDVSRSSFNSSISVFSSIFAIPSDVQTSSNRGVLPSAATTTYRPVNSNFATATDNTPGNTPGDTFENSLLNGFPMTTFGAGNLTGGIDSSGANQGSTVAPSSNSGALHGEETLWDLTGQSTLVTRTSNTPGNTAGNGFSTIIPGPNNTPGGIGISGKGQSSSLISRTGSNAPRSSTLVNQESSPSLAPGTPPSYTPDEGFSFLSTGPSSDPIPATGGSASGSSILSNPGSSPFLAPGTSVPHTPAGGINSSGISQISSLAPGNGGNAPRSSTLVDSGLPPFPGSGTPSPSFPTIDNSSSNTGLSSTSDTGGHMPGSPTVLLSRTSPVSASGFQPPSIPIEGISSFNTSLSSALETGDHTTEPPVGVNSGSTAFPASATSPPSTSLDSGASPSSSAPIASPSNGNRTFQLYISNDVEGLDTLAVGESGDGQLVVGGVVNATVLTITNATNMTDLDHNYIYFVPNPSPSSRLAGRQDTDTDPTLRYAPDPPSNAVTSGFTLQNITLSSNSTEGNYTFYTCSRDPQAQPIYVAEVGQTPGRCYNFDLVTTPPPLNNKNATSSEAMLSATVPTSLDVRSSSSADLELFSSGGAGSLTGSLRDSPSSSSASPSSSGPGVFSDLASQTMSSSDTAISSSPGANLTDNQQDTTSTTPDVGTSNAPAAAVTSSSDNGAFGNAGIDTSHSSVLSSGPATGMSSSLNSRSTSSSNHEITSDTNAAMSSDIGTVSSLSVGLSSQSSGLAASPLNSPAAAISSGPDATTSISGLPTSLSSSPAAATSNSPDATTSTSGLPTSLSNSPAAAISSGPQATMLTSGLVTSPSSDLYGTSRLNGPGSGSSTTSTPLPRVVQNTQGYDNAGLYYDNTNSRLLSAASTSNPAMSVEFCAFYCSTYSYFGVENGDTCFCGNTFSSQPLPLRDQSGASDTVCLGNLTEYCGGSDAIQVYATGSLASSSLLITSTAVILAAQTTILPSSQDLFSAAKASYPDQTSSSQVGQTPTSPDQSSSTQSDQTSGSASQAALSSSSSNPTSDSSLPASQTLSSGAQPLSTSNISSSSLPSQGLSVDLGTVLISSSSQPIPDSSLPAAQTLSFGAQPSPSVESSISTLDIFSSSLTSQNSSVDLGTALGSSSSVPLPDSSLGAAQASSSDTKTSLSLKLSMSTPDDYHSSLSSQGSSIDLSLLTGAASGPDMQTPGSTSGDSNIITSPSFGSSTDHVTISSFLSTSSSVLDPALSRSRSSDDLAGMTTQISDAERTTSDSSTKASSSHVSSTNTEASLGSSSSTSSDLASSVPVSSTPASSTAAPSTAGPSTPAPNTLASNTPAFSTTASSTVASSTPASSTPASSTPASISSASSISTPSTPIASSSSSLTSPSLTTSSLITSSPLTVGTASTIVSSTLSTINTPALIASATSIIVSQTLFSFCSSLLGFTTAGTTTTTTVVHSDFVVNTVAVLTTSTATATVTQTSFTTVPSTTTQPVTTVTLTSYKYAASTVRAYKKRDLWVRQAVSSTLTTPSALATFPPAVVTSACSEEATPSTLTQTSTSTYSSTSTLTVQSTAIVTVSQTTTKTVSISSGIHTNPVSTTTVTTTITSTTTITLASGAPTASPNYLSISPDPNTGAAWALSDPSSHLTDNYFFPNRREVFELTSIGQLYSVTNNSWYGISATHDTGSTANKLYWDTRSQYGNKTFFGNALTDGTGRTQLFLNNTATGTPFSFCIADQASADSNAATGFHVYFYSTAAPYSTNCISCHLYLSPISNG